MSSVPFVWLVALSFALPLSLSLSLPTSQTSRIRTLPPHLYVAYQLHTRTFTTRACRKAFLSCALRRRLPLA